MVRQRAHPVAAQSFDMKSAVVKPVSVPDLAAPVKKPCPVAAIDKTMEIVVPEMIIAHKGKVIRAQAEIHIQRHPSVPP